MASDDLFAAVTAVEDEKFSFKRSEMFKEILAGTVNAYDRHVFLCYKTPEAWPSCVEGSEFDPLSKLARTTSPLRGQIGASSDEAEKINDQKLSNGGESKKIEEKLQENGNQIQNNENFSGCCQGANSNNGFTCCKEVSLEQNNGSEEKKVKDTRESCARNDALGKLSSSIENWEQSGILTAAAVVGAVATVAAAYSFYRRSV